MTHPVYMLGLDACDVGLVNRWAGSGDLPNFARLLREGAKGRVCSSSSVLQGSVWPTFATGRDPGDHGMYYMLQAGSGSHRLKRVRARDCRALPFWSELPASGRRSVVIDVPKLGLAPLDNSAQIVEWGAMDHYSQFATHPASLAADVLARFNKHVLFDRLDEPHDPSDYSRLLNGLIDGAERRTRLGAALIDEWNPDLFISVYAESHPAGHYFWRFMDGGDLAAKEEPFADAIRDVYRALDRSIGQICADYADQANLIIFSGHGMTRDDYPRWILDDLLVRMGLTVHRDATSRPRSAGEEKGIETSSPGEDPGPTGQPSGAPARPPRTLEKRLRRFATRHVIPWSVREKLWIHRLERGIDFTRSSAWALPTDLQGFVRINLEGREADGIVPKDDYERLVEDICVTLAGLTDRETGEPIVDQVFKTAALYPDARHVDALPDVCVLWRNAPVRQVHSDRLGDFFLSKFSAERSGNHRPEGFFLAIGPDIVPGFDHGEVDLAALGPTALRLLNAPIPDGLKCRPIDMTRRGSG